MNNLIEIEKTSMYIKYYCSKRFIEKMNHLQLFSELLEYIAYSMYNWSSNTYVGIRKEEKEQKIYQDFFEQVCFLIDTLENNKENNISLENEFLHSIKYNGKIYRYLGYGNPKDKNRNKHVVPQYNNIYVSWSKNENNSYLDTKLYGKKTKIKAYINNNAYGLDLEEFQNFINNKFEHQLLISKGQEREVVFPTLEEYIKEIIYE